MPDVCGTNENLYRLFVDEATSYAIIFLDDKGRITYWNAGAERLFGYPAAEAVGKMAELIFMPEDVRAGVPRAEIATATATGQAEDRRWKVRKDGTTFFADGMLFSLHDKGKLCGFAKVVRDATEQRHIEEERAENEERVRFVAEVSSALSASIEYDVTLQRIAKLVVARIADWCAIDLLENGALSRVTVEHIDPAKVQFAKDLQERYPPGRDDSTVLRERQTLFYPEISDEMLRGFTRDAEHLNLLRQLGLRSAIITPLVAGGKMLGVMTLVTAGARCLTADDVTLAEDVASRAATAVQNAQLYRDARQANRAKDDFLATVSHELRTPMTAILGWAQLLRNERDTTVISEAAKAIERSAAIQSQLINDILDVARIRVGKLRMHFQPANLADVVDLAVGMVRMSAKEKGVRLRTEVDRRDVMAEGDAQRLQQVVWNLLTNAIKFTPAGGVIDVALRQEDGTAILTVHDSGPGIAREFLPYLFERFRQAAESERPSHGGLGLGLSIASHIVAAHGGKIEAEPGGNGNGATFIVKLPMLKEVLQQRELRGRRTNDDLEDLGGVRVLIVEDDPDTLHFLSRTFERAGADVDIAASVDEALDKFRTREPDIVVSDIAMPRRTGYELAQTIRKSGSRVPCLALTASGVVGDRERALAAGFDEYLRKPVEPHALVHMVRTMLPVRSHR